MIDLRKKDHDTLCALAQQFFLPGTEIWAYGSRVKGTNHETSDLDLVVRFPECADRKMQEQQLERFCEAVQESTIPILVQILCWHSIPEYFKKTIGKRYEVLLSG